MSKTKKSSSKKSTKFNAKITWLPKKTFELEFSIPWDKVKTSYDKVLTQLTKETKLEGFRQGKAPKDMVEKSVDQGKLYGEVINQLLPLSYAQAISQHGLKPATAPKVQILKAQPNQAWEFKATSCELPEFKLGDYQKIIKGALAKDKLWTPDKGLSASGVSDPKKVKKEKPEVTQTQKLNLITKALLDETKIELSKILIETEKNRLLSRFLDQIQKLGLTLEQYAASNQKTVDQIKQEYEKTAENTLKMELILQAIADDKKYKAEDKDIDAMIASAGDEKIKKQLNTPAERAYIASVVRKRQVIDYLSNL